MKRSRHLAGVLVRGSAASAMLLLIWALLGSAISSTPPATGLLLNLLLFPVFVALAAGAHEVGHAVTGHLAGLRVVQISIGAGAPWSRFKVGQVDVRLHEFPLGGMTWMVPYSDRGIRWRMWLAVLGGPLTNALILLVTSAAMLEVGVASLLVHGRFAPLETWMIAHLAVLLISLMPSFLPCGGDSTVSDGVALLEIPLMTEPEKIRLLNAGRVVAAREACERHEHDRALELCASGLQRDPDCVPLRNLQGCVFLEKRQFELAREIFADLLRREGLAPPWRDIAQSNFAWSALRLGNEDMLKEALHHSEQVFRRQAEANWARTTHGAVLVQLGRYREAIALLRVGLSGQGDRASMAHDACWLAIAEARLGNDREAGSYLQRARDLDASCYSLADAERAVAPFARPSGWPKSCPVRG